MNFKNKLGQGLPVNVIVMLILGIIIFGLGMGLFAKMSNSGDEQIDQLNDQIKTGISSLACNNDESAICVPTFKMDSDDRGNFKIYITNTENTRKDYKVVFDGGLNANGAYELTKPSCSATIYAFIPAIEFSIEAGESASIPFIAKVNTIGQTPCSVMGTAILLKSPFNPSTATNIVAKTPVIIKVER